MGGCLITIINVMIIALFQYGHAASFNGRCDIIMDLIAIRRANNFPLAIYVMATFPCLLSVAHFLFINEDRVGFRVSSNGGGFVLSNPSGRSMDVFNVMFGA